MNKEVHNSLNFIDVILFVIEATKWNELDENVLNVLKKISLKKVILILNKVDKVNNKTDLLSIIKAVSDKAEISDIIPLSAKKGEGIDKLLSLIVNKLPIAPPIYPEDQITDKNERFFAAEFIREKLILRLSDELPYRISVTVDEFKEEENIIHILATIWVEKQGQKSIVIGNRGSVLKSAGKAAREDMEMLFDKKVNLKTWVKVKKKWADSEQALKQFGYQD